MDIMTFLHLKRQEGSMAKGVMARMDIVAMLREKSRLIAPDYPGIDKDLEPWEHLWAITSSYEGCSLANDDLHKLVAMLCAKLNTTPLEAWEEWKREQAKSTGS